MSIAYVPAPRISASQKLHHVEDESVMYWKRLKQFSVIKEPGPVTSVAISPRRPFHIATTSSVRLTLYDSVACEQLNLFTRFKQAVYGAKFRKDGQLIAVGSQEGKVRVFDMNKSTGTGKAPLRSVKASSSSIRAVEFTANGKSVYSASDEGVVALWDLADTGSKSVLSFNAHADTIRAVVASKVNDSLLLTGGYDHKVKLWDVRSASADGPTLELDVGFPVESMLFLPNESLLATAAGQVVKIWDLAAGGRALSSLTAHNKTVTCLTLDGPGRHLLTGGIDRRINVVNTTDFSVVHSYSMAAPVLGLAMSADDRMMAVGMGSLLAIYRRAPEKKDLISTNIGQSNKKMVVRVAAPLVAVQERGGEKKKQEIHAKAEDQLRLTQVDRKLKGFAHAGAIQRMFTCSFWSKMRYEQCVGALQVIVYRRAIHRALAGQTTRVHVNLLRFLIKNLFKSNFYEILSHVALALLEVLAKEHVDKEVARLSVKLKDAVHRELSIQRQLCQTMGVMEMVMHSARAAAERAHVVSDESDDDGGDVFGEPTVTMLTLNLIDKNDEVEMKKEDEMKGTVKSEVAAAVESTANASIVNQPEVVMSSAGSAVAQKKDQRKRHLSTSSRT